MVRIIASYEDKAIPDYTAAADRLQIPLEVFFYEEFSFADTELLYQSEPFVGFHSGDALLFRRPEYENTNQHFWVRMLSVLAQQSGAYVADEQHMISFPVYSDKLFQAAFFSLYQLEHISTYRFSEAQNRGLQTPLIIKRRLGAFGRDSHLVETEKDWTKIDQNMFRNGDEYVVQRYKSLRRDVRIVVVGGEILGAVERQVIKHADGQVTVKVSAPTDLLPIERDIAERTIAAFHIEIAGLDIFTAQNDQHCWLGEVNFFPNFSGYDAATHTNVPEKIMTYLESKTKK